MVEHRKSAHMRWCSGRSRHWENFIIFVNDEEEENWTFLPNEKKKLLFTSNENEQLSHKLNAQLLKYSVGNCFRVDLEWFWCSFMFVKMKNLSRKNNSYADLRTTTQQRTNDMSPCWFSGSEFIGVACWKKNGRLAW